MTVWDDITSTVDDASALQRLQPLLSRVAGPSTDVVDDNGDPWRRWNSDALDGEDPLVLVPGRSSAGSPSSADDGVLVVPDTSVGVVVELALDAPGGSPTGGIRVTLTTPGSIYRPPGLVPAILDAQGQLRPDTTKRHVDVRLPRLRIRFDRPANGAFTTRLLGASSDPAAPDADGPDRLYEFIRMEPPYALSGPDATFGFAFRGAVLDMSETDTPSSGAADAITLPDDWQGLWLPEARIFVAPNGLQGLAVSAGVRDLYLGIGEHDGLSGEFQVEVVSRGSAPQLMLRLQTGRGELVAIDPTATTAEAPAGSTIVADANGGLAPHTFQLTVDGAVVASDRASLGALAAPVVVVARVTDAGGNPTERTVTISLRTTGPGGGDPPTTNPARLQAPPDQDVRIVVAQQNATTVTLHAPDANGTLQWSVDGASAGGGPTLELPLAAGATATVEATETLAATTVEEHCYFTFDEPSVSDLQVTGSSGAEAPDGEALRVYASTSRNASTRAQQGRGALAEPYFRDGIAQRIARYGAVTDWRIDGFASYEGRPGKADHNLRLSRRRMWVLEEILAHAGIGGVTLGTAHGHGPAATPGAVDPAGGVWRRATLRGTSTTVLTGTATLTRDPAPDPSPGTDVDPAPPPSGTPDCFRLIGVRVRIERDVFTRLEVYGSFDVQTAAESRLPAASNSLPGNPADGIVSFLIGLKLAADRTSWEVRGEFRGADTDIDGLVRWADSEGDDTALNIVGGVAIMAPLLATATPPKPSDGADLIPVALGGATAAALGAAGVLKTHSLILRAVELVVSDAPVTAADPTGATRTSVTLLFDVEAGFSFDAGIIEIDPHRPVTTRYKAVGVRAGWDEVDDGVGGVDYLPVPVFDSSKGYTLDIPAGSMSAKPPLDKLLRVLGVQVSRSNPVYLELEVGLGIDLGIVTVDSARVRVKLEAPTSIELTKLAASIEVPGALHGSGWVSIEPNGFSGALDITLTAINLRASATLTVRSHPTDGYTGVLIGAEVEFPVPLVLGNSGLGILGFSGGVAINHTRNSGTEPTAALTWVHNQLGPARGSVMHPDGWDLEAETYAIAAGMLVGTLEGGFMLHLKGMLLVEIPGPRLLLIMKADVLELPPALGSQQSATFLAVLDIDVARGTITIAIVAEYTIEKVLQVRVPVTAFFPTKGKTDDWYIDLGSFSDPVTVSVLSVFEGTGYLMIHGGGLTHPALGITTTGLTVATGFHFRAVIMGSKSIGLYLEAAAGFDALLTFEPVFLAGRVHVSGELRLFIVSIGASAELEVRVGQESLDSPAQTTYVSGTVCGKVDFFFFSVKGCVSLEIGSKPKMPPAPDLLADVSLVARGPVILEGDGAGQPIDGKLTTAVEDPAAVAAADRELVPIDAIPVVQFTATPDLTDTATLLGKPPASDTSAKFTGGWVRRGDLWVIYRVSAVDLLENGTAFDPDGQATPCTWWISSPPDASVPDRLALLSWVPDHTPHALPYGEKLVDAVKREWDVCTPAPPPAASLWTFDHQPAGPDPDGWRLRGVRWPDPSSAVPVTRPNVDVDVTEPWRTGVPVADLLGPAPAVVLADAVACPTPDPIEPGLRAWDDGNPPSATAGLHHAGGTRQLAAALAAGVSLLDATAHVSATGWQPQIGPEDGACWGRILRSPAGQDDRPTADGPPEDVRVVEDAWTATGHTPNELRNAVRAAPTSPLATASVLLLASRRALDLGALRVRRLDAKGQAIDDTAVTEAHRLGGGVGSLPPEWWDPAAGPWADPVQRAGRVAARVAAQTLKERDRYALAFVELPDTDGASVIDIGWDRGAPEDLPPFYVVALSGLPVAELMRHTRQSEYIKGRREVLATTLTQDPSNHALLRPGKQYTVRVTWQSQSVEQEAQPTTVDADGWSATQVEERSFWTVPKSAAPDDLGPWLMATAPSTGEVGVLRTQPVRMALTTQSVLRLFAAHDRTLKVRVRAASGSHPAPAGGQPNDLVTIPLVPGGNLHPLNPDIAVTSAFGKALAEVAAGLSCVDPGPAPPPLEVEIPYEFDPLTEYIVDVYAPATAATTVTDADRVHRVQFTTSRFRTVDDIAVMVRDAVVEDRAVTDPTPLTALGTAPPGPELDEAFIRAGLDVPRVPRFPGTQVLWGRRGGVVEPVAVVVDSSEPLWRSRVLPKENQDTSQSPDPKHTWWVREPQEWLRVDTGGSAQVDRIVHGPGDTRAVVLLAPGQRGRTLELELVQCRNPFWRASSDPADGDEHRAPLGSLLLDRPIWEMED